MSNKHYNGDEPIVMSASEYDRQAELWEANGGSIRDDHPHTGADYDHAHWYDGDNKNEDFVVVRQSDDDPQDRPSEEPSSGDDGDDGGDDDD